VGKWIDPVEHGRFLSENHGVLDKILPFDRMELLELFQKRHASVLVFLTDDFAQ